MDIPIEIFLSFIAFSLVTGIIGLWKRTPLMLFIAGAMITFWAIITDNIILGKIPESSIVSGLTTTYTFIDNPFEFTQWHKIFFALIGSVIMIAGALIWKQMED